MAEQESVTAALDRIDSAASKERIDGVAALQRVLRYNKRNLQHGSLKDAAFHKMFEVLFRFAAVERPLYMKSLTSTSKTTRNSHATRLALGASTLRLAVEIGCSRIKSKTARALIDHLCETVLDPDGDVLEPIALDYAKCLNLVLSFPPHAEHLQETEWEELSDFCLDRIGVRNTDTKQDSFPGASLDSSKFSSRVLSVRSSRTKTHVSQDAQLPSSLRKSLYGEFLSCLRYLTDLQAAPIERIGKSLPSVLLPFLEITKDVGNAKVDALAVVNNYLSCRRVDATQEIARLCPRLARIAGHLWNDKSAAQKDALLVMLVLVLPHTRHGLQSLHAVETKESIKFLSEILLQEYSKRSEREQLRLEDMLLRFPTPSSEMSNPLLGLDHGERRVEANWTILTLLTWYSTSPDAIDVEADLSQDEYNDNERSKKRLRRTQWIDELSDMLRSMHSATRVCALQLLTFRTVLVPNTEDEIAQLIDYLTPILGDDNNAIASWAFMAMSGCALQIVATNLTLRNRWTVAWQVGCRAINGVATSRAASHFLRTLVQTNLVSHQALAQLAEACSSSMEVYGPSVYSDASSALLRDIIVRSRAERLACAEPLAERALAWLFQKWRPHDIGEKSQMTSNAHLSFDDILDLIYVCIAKPRDHVSNPMFANWGIVAQSWMMVAQDRDILNYLLLEDDVQAHLVTIADETPVSDAGRSTPKSALTSLALTLCTKEAEQALEKWKSSLVSRSTVSNDVVRALCTLLCVSNCIANCLAGIDNHRAALMQSANGKLLANLRTYLSSTDCDQTAVDTATQVFCTPQTYSSPTEEHRKADHSCIIGLCAKMSICLETRREASQLDVSDHDIDMMDADPETESQRSGPRAHANDQTRPRRLVPSNVDVVAIRAGSLLYSKIAGSVIATDEAEDDEDERLTTLVNHVVSLSPQDIVSSHQVLSQLPALGVHLGTGSVETILGYLSEKVLMSYTEGRSETTICLVLDFILSHIDLCADPTNKALYNLGIDLYEWFVLTLLPSKVPSSTSSAVQKRLSDLLLQLLGRNADYGQNEDLPSVRTVIFQILRDGSGTVKKFISDRIHVIFTLFTLTNHDAVFDDLLENLPTNSDWLEGIALRILTLSSLGSRWHTLLRRSVYHIFDTAGKVVASAEHAAQSIRKMAHALAFEQPKELFKLFCSQLCFTWLSERRLQDIPYAVFGYQSLTQLLDDNQVEVYSQLALLDKSDDGRYCANLLETTEQDLLRRSIGKTVAYAISQDVSDAHMGSQSSCESRIREMFTSKVEYVALVRANVLDIVAQVWVSMQQDGSVDKSLEKRPSYQRASHALAAMKSFGSSTGPGSTSLQPSFKAKCLMDQLDRVCRRANTTISEIFNPAGFTFVFRSLISTVHPALGPLHACQTIQKLRILVAISADTVSQGYPLQALLQTLKPFLHKSQCADDTIGMLHYLYESGKDHLRQNIPLLTGSAILTLLYLKSFMNSKKDTTTQESQYRSTVSRMQGFHDWLVGYLIDSQDTASDKNRARYLSLVEACRDLVLPATMTKGNAASVVMLALLDDLQSSHPLMDPTLREAVFEFLCRNFQAPPSRTEDALADDTMSVKYAGRLWESIGKTQASTQYTYWVAVVLGRAYAATGSAVANGNRSTRPSRLRADMTAATTSDSESKLAIIAKLTKLLFDRDGEHAAIAEATLRSMLVRHTDASESLTFEQFLPADVVLALATLDKGTSPCATSKAPNPAELERRLTNLRTASTREVWATLLIDLLCDVANQDPVLGALSSICNKVEHLAEQLLPFAVHLALLHETDKMQVVRSTVSRICTTQFAVQTAPNKARNRLLLESLVYLLTQAIPQETTRMDRLEWLEVDLFSAARAAVECGNAKTALFLVELMPPQEATGRGSRRSSITAEHVSPPEGLLFEIFKQVDDPDSFYGVERPSSLTSVVDKLDHEGDGLKALMLHSARLDASLRNAQHDDEIDSLGMVKALGVLNINSLTNMLLNQRSGQGASAGLTDTMLESARKLDQWDVASTGVEKTNTQLLYNSLRDLRNTTSTAGLQTQLHVAFQKTIANLIKTTATPSSIQASLQSLAVITEIDELRRIRSAADLARFWENGERRRKGWDVGQVNEAMELSSYRESMFGILRRNKQLRDSLHVSARDTFLIETKTVIQNSVLSRKHGSLQQALSAATYLSKLEPLCAEVGLNIGAAAQLEAACVLWKQDEITSSVKMLRELCLRTDLEDQPLALGRAGMLAQLGHQIATARLEKPEDVISRYLKPAIEHLRKSTSGSETGSVFFEFASFCHQQLQNPDSLEDFSRLCALRDRKYKEFRQLENLLQSTPSSQKDTRHQINQSKVRARQWFALDDHEYKIAAQARDEFKQQSLINYLRALMACDDYDASVVRFFALWLENSELEIANKGVQENLDLVPSWKFVVLLNQQMSRLSNEDSLFQQLLSKLVHRICAEHPYHSVHHIFSSCFSKISDKDALAQSRKSAAVKIANSLRADKKIGGLYQKMWEASQLYHALASHPVAVTKTNKLPLRGVKPAYQMNKRVIELSVPPATLNLDLRPAGDYRQVPIITSFRDEISIASGLSAPKILTARATDGNRYKQLFKGGNDDLRQDAIMEQVFGEASKILRKDKETRRRNLLVRTYKVIPLSPTSGIMEFVQDSIPLHDVVVPAHAKYHPKDLTVNKAREAIKNAAGHNKDHRVRVYQEVASKYRPVLRHFFLERFEDPDEWFARRLAYSRSTAAISMLGYVLGLGDRHCHNILLDEKSGEVIHIDLGVAFEAGRVLPIPEVVPFRLTRDIVDGMGITKTEGVFRRCCEFTMEALRHDKDSIMTLLNVLRYDPLYSWTVSPLRAKKMQEAQDEELENGGRVPDSKKAETSEAGEAERALAVVEKKLSKTLSTAATVNELIQQATDERNLAVLFAGWAAYS